MPVSPRPSLPAVPLAILAVLAAAALSAPRASGGPTDPSIGVVTRGDEFRKRQEAMDAKVLALRDLPEARRKKAVADLAKEAERDIECLLRYRESQVAPVLVEVARASKKWFVRTRALFALKRIPDPSAAPCAAALLADADPSVREAAASLLGHVGGDAAREALGKRAGAERDPYVLATIEAALRISETPARPYGERPDGKAWKETLVGPEGARRVEWVWTKKGQNLFNDYDASAPPPAPTTRFVYPVLRYKEDLFAGYPRNSYGAGGTHAGEDCAWFREGCGYYSVADGVVRMVQGAGGDWGFLVAIEHRRADGTYVTSVYGHAAFDVLVKPGEAVKAGQRIASQGISCGEENGGYGSHLHFGLGNGPFRRPAGLAVGDPFAAPNAAKGGAAPEGRILRFGYDDTLKNGLGWPLTTLAYATPGGGEVVVVSPQQPLQQELGWFQAYVKDCRGWLDPQTTLPAWVEGKAPKGK
jgi:murein DD-endopeptidase MepM/ murein hydrolase activator NlpD